VNRPLAAYAAKPTLRKKNQMAATGTYLLLDRRTFHTARAAIRPINALLEHVFTTLKIRRVNPMPYKPAWMLGACLRLY
jgi:hypothetical protein